MKFQELINKNHKLLTQIYQHSFNEHLCKGSLPAAVFKFYLEQDRIYLNKYAKALKIVSNRCEANHKEYAAYFSNCAQDTIAAEKEVQEKYLKNSQSSSFFSSHQRAHLVTLNYTRHLFKKCRTGFNACCGN